MRGYVDHLKTAANGLLRLAPSIVSAISPGLARFVLVQVPFDCRERLVGHRLMALLIQSEADGANQQMASQASSSVRIITPGSDSPLTMTGEVYAIAQTDKPHLRLSNYW